MTVLDWNSLQNDLLRVADIAEKVSTDLSQLMQDTMSTALPAIHVQKTLASLPFLGFFHNDINHVPDKLNEFMYVAEKRRVTMLHSPAHLTAVIFFVFCRESIRSTPCFASYRIFKRLFQDFEKRKLHSELNVQKAMADKPLNPLLLLQSLKKALLKTCKLCLDASRRKQAPLQADELLGHPSSRNH
jgi:hypothetical protein